MNIHAGRTFMPSTTDRRTMIEEIDTEQYNDEIQITGLYINSMVESMSDVSPVFENKIQNILSENGIEDVQKDEWYEAPAFFSAVQELASSAGPQTVFEVGRSMGRDTPFPEDVDSPHDIFPQMDDFHYEAYKNVDQQSNRSIGGYTYERVDSTTARIGVTEKFPFHSGIAQGSPEGIASSFTNESIDAKEVDTKPTDSNKKPERRAFEVSW